MEKGRGLQQLQPCARSWDRYVYPPRIVVSAALARVASAASRRSVFCGAGLWVPAPHNGVEPGDRRPGAPLQRRLYVYRWCTAGVPQLDPTTAAPYRWWEEGELRDLCTSVGLSDFTRDRQWRFIMFCATKPGGGGPAVQQ